MDSAKEKLEANKVSRIDTRSCYYCQYITISLFNVAFTVTVHYH